MRLLPVRRPYERVRMNVVNQSARQGIGNPYLIVVHDTESHNVDGDADLESIGAWFDNPAAQASSHVCVDAEGRSAQYVPDARKAWHVVQFNSVSLGIEQIGFASQTFWPDAQLKKVAKYVAYWNKKYGIPIVRGDANTPGVVTHAQLGAAGGGHHDPGPNYPMEDMLYHARFYARRGWIH